MKPDDSYLPKEDYLKVRSEAEKALERASGLGCYPTPVADIMRVAKVEEAPESLSEEGLLQKVRGKAEGALRRAVSKVLGILHASANLIFIDRTLHAVKQTFVRLHETAHAFLPWQRELYAVVEDCEKTVSPEIADQFEREANVFASEVLFQIDGFINEASQSHLGVLVPVKLGKKYGASVYSSVRQYVRKNPRACAVLVINPPKFVEGDGFVAELRRAEVSPSFKETCGRIEWQRSFTPDDQLGAMIPVGTRKMTGRRSLSLMDSNGEHHECLAEAFTTGYQVFVLIWLVGKRTGRIFV